MHEIADWLGQLGLEQYAQRFAENEIDVSVLRFPWLDELVTMTVKFPNLHVDTSACVLRRLPPAFVQRMKGIGQGRVMFGTNWPMLPPQRCLEGVGDLGLSKEQSSAFLRGNARRVFAL